MLKVLKQENFIVTTRYEIENSKDTPYKAGKTYCYTANNDPDKFVIVAYCTTPYVSDRMKLINYAREVKEKGILPDNTDIETHLVTGPVGDLYNKWVPAEEFEGIETDGSESNKCPWDE